MSLSQPLSGKSSYGAPPSNSRVVDKDCDAVCPLLDFFNEAIATSLVLEVGDNILALSWSNRVDTVGSFLQF